MIKRLAYTAPILGLVVLATACDEKPLSFGDANSIIAMMPAEQWDEAQDEVYAALEQRVQTVRDEKTFTVTYQEPYAEFYSRLRRFSQAVVVGTRDDEYVQDILEEAREPITENGIHQIYDVWAVGQTITLILLDAGWGADDLAPHLPTVNAMLDEQYRSYARNRMYFSGVDSALADTLSLEAGFAMYFPDVYRWERRDSIFIFRNDNPDPAELIRQITVTWRTPAPGLLDRDQLLEWRTELVAEYSEPQDLVLEDSSERNFTFDGAPAFEIQAQWRNPPERGWPAGGPLLTRTVTCDNQDRTYILDAWLYAPGKEKYEYMIQLETLLDDFRCAS